MATTVQIGGRDIAVQRFTLAKAMRVLTLLSIIQKSIPQISKEIAAFRREYEEENVLVLDRVQAKVEFRPKPILAANGDVATNPQTGEALLSQSPIDAMTDADWQSAGNSLRIRKSPSPTELMMAMFPFAIQHAEQPVMRLLALVTFDNDQVTQFIGRDEIWEQVDQRIRDVIAPAPLEDLMELAVVVGETLEGQVMQKAKQLGGRTGNLLRLLGIEQPAQTSTSEPETSTTSSEQPEPQSTVSASPTPVISTGDPTRSEGSPGTPSSRSEPKPTASVS